MHVRNAAAAAGAATTAARPAPQDVPPTPNPSEEVEWSPARPPRAQVEVLAQHKGGGAALVRNNNTAVMVNNSSTFGGGDLDPLVVPPPSKGELRHRGAGARTVKRK